MAKKGVQLLPPVISEQQMIDIYKILAKVNLQIGTMKSDFFTFYCSFSSRQHFFS